MIEIIPAELLREQLEKSIQEKDVDGLKKAIEDCEAASYPELAAQLRDARDMLASLSGDQGG